MVNRWILVNNDELLLIAYYLCEPAGTCICLILPPRDSLRKATNTFPTNNWYTWKHTWSFRNDTLYSWNRMFWNSSYYLRAPPGTCLFYSKNKRCRAQLFAQETEQKIAASNEKDRIYVFSSMNIWGSEQKRRKWHNCNVLWLLWQKTCRGPFQLQLFRGNIGVAVVFACPEGVPETDRPNAIYHWPLQKLRRWPLYYRNIRQ